LAGGLPPACRAEILGGDYKFNGVFRFSDTGTPVAGSIPSGTAGLQGTAGVEIGPDGNIYVSSKDSGEVLRFSAATGAPLPSPLVGGRDGLFAVLRDSSHPNSGPGPLKFGPNGHLYVADYGGTTVRKFDGVTGAELGTVVTGLAPPAGMTFAADGDLYVGNFGTSAIIRVHNGQKSTFIASGTGPIATPSSLLFVPNGDLLVVSMFANEIHRYSSTGAYLGVFAAIEPLEPAVGNTNYPSDIGFDQNGNILVAVLGATNPPDNRGQILRYRLDEGSVAGTLLNTVVDAYPAIGSVAWIRSANAIVGDFDSNGTVNTADYTKWRGDLGKFVAGGGGADGNGNGVVDAADYVVWRNYQSPGPAIGALQVPEPSSLIMTLLFGISAAPFISKRSCR
jgi:hypothetical protein